MFEFAEHLIQNQLHFRTFIVDLKVNKRMGLMSYPPKRYPYIGLDQEKQHRKYATRLLVLGPRQISENLRCRLIHATVCCEHPQYRALSYSWDGIKATRPINVDGYDLYIGLNLIQALQHLRQSLQDTYLWFDAICINQDDIVERNSQVACNFLLAASC